MRYRRDDVSKYLLAYANNIGNEMLYEESGEYKNTSPINWHLFCITLGTAFCIKLNRKDYIKLDSVTRASFKGIYFDKYSIREFWSSNENYLRHKKILTGSDLMWDYGEYAGIFEFIHKVCTGEIEEFKEPLFKSLVSDESYSRRVWELNVIIKDNFTRALIGQHLNRLLYYINNESKDGLTPIDSMMCYKMASLFGSVANSCRNETIMLLMPPDEAKLYYDNFMDWVKFLEDNSESSLFDWEVPKRSKEELKKLFGTENLNSSVDVQEIDTSIGEDLKNSIKAYLDNGGNAGKLISYINTIS